MLELCLVSGFHMMVVQPFDIANWFFDQPFWDTDLVTLEVSFQKG